jgi:hypothetical protein
MSTTLTVKLSVFNPASSVCEPAHRQQQPTAEGAIPSITKEVAAAGDFVGKLCRTWGWYLVVTAD